MRSSLSVNNIKDVVHVKLLIIQDFLNCFFNFWFYITAIYLSQHLVDQLDQEGLDALVKIVKHQLVKVSGAIVLLLVNLILLCCQGIWFVRRREAEHVVIIWSIVTINLHFCYIWYLSIIFRFIRVLFVVALTVVVPELLLWSCVWKALKSVADAVALVSAFMWSNPISSWVLADVLLTYRLSIVLHA